MAQSIMCSCHQYGGRGCWEHSQREARLVNACRLGYDDGRDGRVTDYFRPLEQWPEDEREWYGAGWALATGARGSFG